MNYETIEETVIRQYQEAKRLSPLEIIRGLEDMMKFNYSVRQMNPGVAARQDYFRQETSPHPDIDPRYDEDRMKLARELIERNKRREEDERKKDK
jgi:hypothetical protein